MKNLFDPKIKEEILSRIDKLAPDSKAHWGKMNVNQNLRHMSLAFDIATGKLNPTPSKPPPIPKWLLKFFLLNAKPPKGKAETFKEMNIVENDINPADFEAERKNLKKAVEDFFNSTSLISENKLVGKFKRNDWGKLNYNHTDHHLRQFGV
jgi:Protein of unknown function (DUF1569)